MAAGFALTLAALLSGGNPQITPPAPDCTGLSRRACRQAFDAWQKESTVAAEQLAAGRALPHDWEAGCYQDRVTLEWSCFATKFFGGPHRLRIESSSVGYCFSSVLNDHPGATAVIRIGNNEPILYSGHMVCGDTAAKIIEQLATETDGAVRGTTWPNRIEEFEFSAVGFPGAMQALEDRVANPRP